MCKHIAAVLYGIGARLDKKPELLFTLRKVNQEDLITRAGATVSNPARRNYSKAKTFPNCSASISRTPNGSGDPADTGGSHVNIKVL